MKKQFILPIAMLSSVWLIHTQAQNCSTPSFNEVKNISACRPGSIVKYDFNGDGNLDIAFTSNCDITPSNITVLFGNGDGSFIFHSENIVNSPSRFMTSGDFNNDGNVDLVASIYATNTVSVLQGDGTGNFGPASYFPVGRSPWGVAVGDFNRDGKPDLAVANSYFDSTSRDTSLWVYSKWISILLGDGNGGFLPADSIEVGNAPTWVVTDDFDGDGKLDLAVANNFSFNVSILLGNGKGSFGLPSYLPAEPGGGATCVAAGDFNGDHRPDLAVSNFYQDDVCILLNNGRGSFSHAGNYPAGMGVMEIEINDLNGDTHLDLAVVNVVSDNVCILLGDGNGGFGPTTSYQVTAHSYSIAIGDYNNDEKPDLVIPDQSVNNVSLLFGDGAGAFVAPRSLPVASNPLFISKRDFNGDGNIDLLTVNAKTNNISIIAGDGKGGFGAATNFTVGDSAQSVAMGDYNGDDNTDLAVANYKSNNVSVLLGDGNGGFILFTNIAAGSGPSAIVSNDFNTDGHPDLAVTNSLSNNVSILTGIGDGTFRFLTNIAVGIDPRSIVVGNFNEDNYTDLAVSNYRSNNVTILSGNGTGNFSIVSTVAVGTNPYFVVVCDFNLNGHQDLAVANWGSNNVSVLLGSGDGTFSTSGTFLSGWNPRSMDVADLNEDNVPDLAVANWGSLTQGSANFPGITILIGNGSGGFALASKIPTARQATSVAIADFNEDGNLDMACGGYFATRFMLQPYFKVGFVSVFLNIEKPQFFVKSATPDALTPPNHKMVDVALKYWAIDNCPESLIYKLLSVTSNEPDYGLDGEDVPGDILIIDDSTLKLRAERSSIGDGRIYTATIMTTDGEGNSDITTIPIVVSKNAAITQSQKISQEIFESNNSGFELSVRPNPTESSFSLLVKTANQTERITLQVFDQSGRLVETRRLSNELTSRIGSLYRPGVYFLRIIQGREHKEIKVLKHS